MNLASDQGHETLAFCEVDESFLKDLRKADNDFPSADPCPTSWNAKKSNHLGVDNPVTSDN